MRVLLVEDDLETAEFIVRGLSEAGETVIHETMAREGVFQATNGDFDVVVFDRMLPDMDGLDAVRILRQSNSDASILMLTAMTGIDDRVDGLNAGADDYMLKPFAFAELYARLRALMRRKPLRDQSIHLLSLIHI